MKPIPLSSGSNTSWALPLAKQNKWILIDAGAEIDNPKPSYSWDLMQTALLNENITPKDIEFVLITHEHIDHAGLAYKWAANGTTILAHPFAQSKLIQGNAAHVADRIRRIEYLRKNGLPDSIAENLQKSSAVPAMRWQSCPASAIATVSHLDEIDLAENKKLTIISAPGHTRGNLVALIKEDSALFSGDTLLEKTIPTSGLHFVEDEMKKSDSFVSNYSHWPSLPAFIHSVNEIQKEQISTIYPGHGPQIDNPTHVFQRFLKHHEKRGHRINLFLENNKDYNPYMIAKLMFPRVSNQQIVQAMIEIIGHLDLREISEDMKAV